MRIKNFTRRSRRRQSAPSPTQLGHTRVGHLNMSKSDNIRLRWERVGVRGYDLSLGRNPSPELLRNSTSPDGRGGAKCGARVKFQMPDQSEGSRVNQAASASASLVAGAGSGARGRRGSGKSWLS